MRIGTRILAVGLICGLLGLVACGGGAEKAAQEAAAQAAAMWTALQDAKANLDSKRDELRLLKDQVAGLVPVEVAEGVEPPTPEALQEQLQAVKAEVSSLTDDFGGQLITFINEQQIGVGDEMNEMQRGALRMKSSEDMVLAQEYIDEGGDYARAIGIYQQAMAIDPDNPDLQAALALAETQQYMTEERFAEVKKKMTRDEVRATIGQVNLRNVQQYDDRGVIAWFYKKEDQGAAGVFFREKSMGNEDWQVYKTDFNAVKPPSAEEG